MMESKANSDSCISLYNNQVGGHHCILSYNGYIYKPYNEHESSIYSSIPYKFPHLLLFLPKFFGVINFASLDTACTSPP